MQVLIVDDSQIMRKIIIGALKKCGVNDIIEASNGLEAIETLGKQADIGLVLMDWNMPTMTGIEAVKKIRSASIKTPVVMVTTEAEKEKVIEAIKSGANDYLIKPFSPKDIQSKLEKFLQS
ncbi:chemotaxis regulator transmitting signal to flagellar motor component [Candidatus Zixiibacteriota bacterium]|nr:chemotaxis regulator transmitting signal to flagellar motor component [candidate division Zixibacteria bacterium]